MAVEKLEISKDALNSLLNQEVEVKDRTDQAADLPEVPEETEEVRNDILEEEVIEDKDKHIPSSNPEGEISTQTKDKENPSEDKGQGNTEGQEQSDEELEVVKDTINLIESKLGVIFSDEELAGIELKGDLETIAILSELGATKKAESIVSDFFKDQPDLYEYAMHIKAGGTKESYFARENEIPNLDNITIPKDNEAIQEKWYKNYLQATGKDEEEIEDLITLAKDKGTLFDKSVKGFDKLKDHYTGLRQEKIKADTTKVQEIEEAKIQTFKDIRKVIDSGKLLNTNINKEEGKELFDYFTKPIDKTGITLREQKWNNITLEQEMLIENIIRKDFKGFLPEQEKQKATKTLLDLKKANEGRTNKIGGERKQDNFTSGGKLNISSEELKTLLQQ